MNNRIGTKKVLGLSALLWATLSLAEDTGFATHTELGYVSTSGNTNTKSGAVDFVGKQKWENQAIQLDLNYIYGEPEGIETNNKLATEFNYDYTIAGDLAFNYLVGYKNDKFSGFDYQFYTGPGLKYQAVKSDEHTLDLQGNIVYSVDEGSDKFFDALGAEIKYPNPTNIIPITTIAGQTNEYASYLLKGDYAWKITETFKFTQKLSYRSSFESSDNYFAYSKTGVVSKINATFSMGMNYKIDYTNQPPAGNVYADKTFTASLIIDY